MDIPDKVYSIYMRTRIKAHKVLEVDEDGRLWIDDGYKLRLSWDGEKYTSAASYTRFYRSREDAIEASLVTCRRDIVKAKREIKSNERAIEKLEGMKASGR